MNDLGLGQVEKIVFAGDWHGDGRYAQRAIREAGRAGLVEVILHTGDFGFRFASGYLDLLDQTAREAHLVVAFVDGNHEDFDWLLAQPVDADGVRRLRKRVWHLPRGLRWTWSETRFLALGGAHSVDRPSRIAGVSWWPQETLTQVDVDLACTGGEVDIMVTHDCPAGVDIPGLSETEHYWPEVELRASSSHREVLAQVVDVVKPDLLVHGHYHRLYAGQLGATKIMGLDCNGAPFDRNMMGVTLSGS